MRASPSINGIKTVESWFNDFLMNSFEHLKNETLFKTCWPKKVTAVDILSTNRSVIKKKSGAKRYNLYLLFRFAPALVLYSYGWWALYFEEKQPLL